VAVLHSDWPIAADDSRLSSYACSGAEEVDTRADRFLSMRR